MLPTTTPVTGIGPTWCWVSLTVVNGEPGPGRGGETALFAAYLSFLRETVITKVLGLTEAERRRTRLPSGWTPIELLSHLLHMERRWIAGVFLGEELPERWGDWNVEDPWSAEGPSRQDGRWYVAPQVGAEALAGRLREVGARTRSVLAEHDLGEVARGGYGSQELTADLRWICFHVLHEYARHAGHLDIACELADAEPG